MSLEIHRLLDEAFDGSSTTAGSAGRADEVQDLKEEMRANLVARVAELEASGLAPVEAARRAMAEVGDVRAIIAELPERFEAPQDRHHVRPHPAFVLRTLVLSLVGTAALAAGVLLATGVLPLGERPTLARAVVIVVAALAFGWVVRDALGQETSTNYPVGKRRARAFGVAALLGIGGLGSAATYGVTRELAWLAVAAAPVLASVVWFTYLGATQTNRHKAWVLRERQVGDRFSQDPVAAARFGIYTVTIWMVALAGVGVLGVTIGWAWSWLALLAGVVVFMLTLAHMLFGARLQDPTSR